MSATGCLITSTPQFEPRKHTAPFLLESGASPDTRQVVVVDKQQVMPLTFTANVVSQDDLPDSTGKFQNVYSMLYIDLGFGVVPNQPFLWYIQSGPPLPPGTLDQTAPRTVSQTWYPLQYSVPPGCHTATLAASHDFDPATHCAACGNDFTSLTWQVLSCDSSIKGNCDDLPIGGGTTACAFQLDPHSATACAQVEADAGTGCPDTSGGSP